MNYSNHDDEISKGPIEMRFPVVCFVLNRIVVKPNGVGSVVLVWNLGVCSFPRSQSYVRFLLLPSLGAISPPHVCVCNDGEGL